MGMKITAGIIAAALFIGFNGAVALKMKEISLAIVILIGFVLMAVDLYQSIKSKDD